MIICQFNVNIIAKCGCMRVCTNHVHISVCIKYMCIVAHMIESICILMRILFL